jgi:5-methylthioribose kinase
VSLDIEDPGQLRDYLRASGRIRPDETIHATPLAGGVSNRAVIVRRESGEEWVVKQALAKLRVKVDWFGDPERIHREALALRTLARLAPSGAVPRFVWEDREMHLLAMSAVPRPHENWKEMLLRGGAGLPHVPEFGRLLATIHTRAADQRHWVEPPFRDTSFFESLRLEPYYRYTATRLPEAAEFLTRLADESLRVRATLVHGDFSPKNVLVHQGRLVLLDFEVAHFGDPAFDVGFALTHLLSKANHLLRARERFIASAADFWRIYRTGLGAACGDAELETRAVQHTLACLLARVDGRSTLEYLSEEERSRQRALALALVREPPDAVPALVAAWARGLEETDAAD